MKRWIALALLVTFALAAWWIFRLPESGSLSPSAQEQTQATAISPARPALELPPPDALQQVESHPMAVAFGEDPAQATREPHQLLEFYQLYRERFGSYPTGEDNPQMLRALMGANPERLPIFPREHPRLNSEGALLDAWGTPFHFHLLSSQHLEIISAGPDRDLFTEDDIVAGHRSD